MVNFKTLLVLTDKDTQRKVHTSVLEALKEADFNKKNVLKLRSMTADVNVMENKWEKSEMLVKTQMFC